MDHHARYYRDSPQATTHHSYAEDRGHHRAPFAPAYHNRGEDHRRTYRGQQPSSSHVLKTPVAAPKELAHSTQRRHSSVAYRHEAPKELEASAHSTRRRHSSSVAYRHEAPHEHAQRVHWTPSTYRVPPSEASYLHTTHSQPYQDHRHSARYASYYQSPRGRSYHSDREPVYRLDDRHSTSPPQDSHRDRRHSLRDLESRSTHRGSRQQRIYGQNQSDTYEHVRKPERSERYSRGYTDSRRRRSDAGHSSSYSRYPPSSRPSERVGSRLLYRAVDPFSMHQSKQSSPSHTAGARPIWSQLRHTVRHLGNKLFFPVHESHSLRGTSALKKGSKERRKD